MVQFSQLRISDDGKHMYIDAHVNTSPQFANRYIESLIILTADKVSEVNPWNTSSDAEYVFKKDFEAGTKDFSLVLTPQMMTERFSKSDFNSDLFFAYVKMAGTPDECVPCNMQTDYTLGVTFNDRLLYQKVMQYTKELVQDCTVPVGFADFILQWNAFKAAINTEHYIPAIRFWKMLFDIDGLGTAMYRNTKPCGCHG